MAHPDEWRLGATCGDCEVEAAVRVAGNRSPDLSSAVFGTVLGGASPNAAKKEWEQTFNTDMHAYREARRAGERPQQVSRKAIRENRQRHEVLERAIDQNKIEVVS